MSSVTTKIANASYSLQRIILLFPEKTTFKKCRTNLFLLKKTSVTFIGTFTQIKYNLCCLLAILETFFLSSEITGEVPKSIMAFQNLITNFRNKVAPMLPLHFVKKNHDSSYNPTSNIYLWIVFLLFVSEDNVKYFQIWG